MLIAPSGSFRYAVALHGACAHVHDGYTLHILSEAYQSTHKATYTYVLDSISYQSIMMTSHPNLLILTVWLADYRTLNFNPTKRQNKVKNPRNRELAEDTREQSNHREYVRHTGACITNHYQRRPYIVSYIGNWSSNEPCGIVRVVADAV